jgi:SNF2 family DNA or RNA helicase
MNEFPYQLAPYDHQRKALIETSNRKFAALFMDPGTGKTKVILDNAAFLFRQKRIRALLVVAPSGVHVNWTRDEIPIHMTEAIKYRVFTWFSSKSKGKRYQRDFQQFLRSPPDELLIFAMNIESIITDAGNKAARKILQSFPTMMVIDESTDIKTPGAKRTKRAKALGRLAAFRRILSGLPDPESPVDLYAQLSFLSPHIVGSSVAKFRARYCEFKQQYVGGGKTIDVISGYRNLEELTNIVQGVSFRARKEDCLDLPPKVYTKRYFELSKEQARMYYDLDEQLQTQFPDTGEEVTANLAIVRKLRQQQIAAGYVPPDDWDVEHQAEPVKRIPGPNPRVQAFEAVVDHYPGQMIVWVRYKMDAVILMDLLGKDAVRYDGTVKSEERLRNMDAFKEGKARFIIASPRAMARGFTLHMAQTVVFYTHYWGLEPRIQAEDRAHRSGLKHTVTYVDIMASDTVDEEIVTSHRNKDDLARKVMGDPKRHWI